MVTICRRQGVLGRQVPMRPGRPSSAEFKHQSLTKMQVLTGGDTVRAPSRKSD
jgi:hypothetical protein